jgi:hypothetical protein
MSLVKTSLREIFSCVFKASLFMYLNFEVGVKTAHAYS